MLKIPNLWFDPRRVILQSQQEQIVKANRLYKNLPVRAVGYDGGIDGRVGGWDNAPALTGAATLWLQGGN